MNKTRRISWVLAAAVGCGVLAGSALAQHRIGDDGRALDANNRLGSGGVNEVGQRIPPHMLGNQIVTGNVTAGREFRGQVDYTDPFAFRGETAGIASDRFIRGSAGVPIRGVTTNNNAQLVQPFYGQSQTAERPPGFQLEASGTGYVPAPIVSRQPGDLRLGRPLEAPIAMPQPGQLILPGPVDPNTQQATVITASPLYGVRLWNFGEESDQQFLSGLHEVGAQRSRLDQRTLERMRQELIDAPEEEDPALADPDAQVPRPTGAFEFRLDRPFEAPQDRALGGPAMQDRTSGRPLESGVYTDQRAGQRVITAPERQSQTYAELQRRLQRFNRLPESSAELEAHRQYNEMLRAQRQREEGEGVAGPGVAVRPADRAPVPPAPTAQPGAPGAMPGQDPVMPQEPDFGIPDFAARSREILRGDRPDAPAPAEGAIPGPVAGAESPLMIKSLATGVQAKGLAEVLNEAESLMREGKFYSALDQYDTAEQVAPNNPMVPLGRAIAELGAGYYNRADQHLREALTADPALMMGQYDLRNFLGQERLEFIDSDLRSIANAEQGEARPVFLLAFLHYNSGDPRRAAAYLDLAERRSDGDPFYQTLRKHWSLPSAPADNK